VKTLPHARQLLRVKTAAVIADCNIHALVMMGDLDCDRAARMTDRANSTARCSTFKGGVEHPLGCAEA
jgi:hypothetical protein